MTPSASPNNKLSIYPIEVTIEAAGGPYKAHALKLTDLGMILEVFVSVFNPHQSLTLKWLLPVENISMVEEAMVIKKYTQNNAGKIVYLMEVHFKQIKFSNASSILSLLGRFPDGKIPMGQAVEEPIKPEVPPVDPNEKKKKT
jgi:hypothetical protein